MALYLTYPAIDYVAGYIPRKNLCGIFINPLVNNRFSNYFLET